MTMQRTAHDHDNDYASNSACGHSKHAKSCCGQDGFLHIAMTSASRHHGSGGHANVRWLVSSPTYTFAMTAYTRPLPAQYIS